MIRSVKKSSKDLQEKYKASRTQLKRLVARFDRMLLNPNRYNSEAVEKKADLIQYVEDRLNCLEFRLGHTEFTEAVDLTYEAARKRNRLEGN